MTKSGWYNAGMTFLSVQWQGFGWCFAVLLLAFAVANIIKLPEPVYYIVERKKKRPKKQYSEPKEITFR